MVTANVGTLRALELSDATLAILPKINPYAERFYNVTGGPECIKNMRMLQDLREIYIRGFISLSTIVLDIDPNTPSLEPNCTFQEKYKGFRRRL